MGQSKLEELQDNLKNKDAPLINRIAHAIPPFLLETDNYRNLTSIELYNLFIQKTNIFIDVDEIAEWTMLFLNEMAKECPRHLLELHVQAENQRPTNLSKITLEEEKEIINYDV